MPRRALILVVVSAVASGAAGLTERRHGTHPHTPPPVPEPTGWNYDRCDMLYGPSAWPSALGDQHSAGGMCLARRFGRLACSLGLLLTCRGGAYPQVPAPRQRMMSSSSRLSTFAMPWTCPPWGIRRVSGGSRDQDRSCQMMWGLS